MHYGRLFSPVRMAIAYFASWFIMQGGSLLKARLGHHKFQMTLRYAHLAPDRLRAEMLKTEGSAHAQHKHRATLWSP